MTDLRGKLDEIYNRDEHSQEKKSRKEENEEFNKMMEDERPYIEDEAEQMEKESEDKKAELDRAKEDNKFLDSETIGLLDRAKKVLGRDKHSAEKFKNLLQELIAENDMSIKDKIEDLS